MSLLVSILAIGVLQTGAAQTLARLKSDAPVLVSELPQLQAALSWQDSELRLAALRFWAARGGEAWGVLYKEVEEQPDASARLEAFSLGVVRSVDLTIDSPDPQMRREGLRTLCALGPDPGDLLIPFRGCAFGPDTSLSGASSFPLAKRVRSNPSLALTLVDDPEATVVFNALFHLGPEDKASLQPTIRKLLSSANPRLKAVGLNQVACASDGEVLRWIAPLIDDPDETIGQYASTEFAARIKNPGALFGSRGAWSPKVREAFAGRIGLYDVPQREEMLVEMLRDPSGDVRSYALELLTRVVLSKPCPVSEPQLREFLLDPHVGVRACALYELSKRQAPGLVELLRVGLTDPSKSMRDTAAAAAGRNFDLSLTDAVVKNLEMGEYGNSSLEGYLSHPANDRFLDGWLESACVAVRQTATQALRPDKDPERFLPRLRKVASDPDPWVRRYAIYGLTACGGPEAAAVIREIGRRSEGDVLLAALGALGSSKDRESVGFLKGYVGSPNEKVGKTATEALRELTDSLIPPVP